MIDQNWPLLTLASLIIVWLLSIVYVNIDTLLRKERRALDFFVSRFMFGLTKATI
jgi:hypothetical protein